MLNLSLCCWQRSIKTLLNPISRRTVADYYRSASRVLLIIYWAVQRREMSKNNKSIPSCTSPILKGFSWLDRRHTTKAFMTQFGQKGTVRDYHLWFSFTILGFSSLRAHRRFHQPTTRRFVFTRLPQMSWKRCCCSVVLSRDYKWNFYWAFLLFDTGTCVFLWTPENYREAK